MNLCHIPSPMSNNNNIGSAINSHSNNNDINAAHMSNYPNYPNISHINWADIDCTDIETIQNKLDMHISSCLSHGWKASIPFHCCVIYEIEVPNNLPTNFTLSQIDIYDYLDGNKCPALRLAFCTTIYMPPSSNDEMSSKLSEQCRGWEDLCRALTIAAWESGNPIVLNGSQLSINNRVFRCGMFHHGPRALTKTKDSPDIISY